MEFILIIDYEPATGPDDIPKIVRMREFLDSHALAKAHEAALAGKNAQ